MRAICPNCERETEIEVVSQEEEIVVRGEPITVHVEFYRCTECGAEFRDPQSPDDPLEEAYRVYRRRRNMLQPEEIRDFRQRHGLTQQELADLLGWGAATLSRYENGALQAEAHDTMLKLVMEPDTLLDLIDDKPEALSKPRREQLRQALEHTVKGREPSFTALYERRFGAYGPDEQSGFRPLQVPKLLNAILFFCDGDEVPKTKLNKLLFYADFKHYKEYSVSITGVQYARLPYGPAPDNYQHYIATLHHEEAAIQITERSFDGYSGEFLTAVKKPDLSLFSTSELKILAMVKERFADVTASEISDLSHKETGYRDTTTGHIISYAYASELSI